MTRTPARPRPELTLAADCVCRQPRCTVSGPCLEAALTDERFGVWPPRRRHRLRLAS